MDSPTTSICLLYDDDGYVEQPGTPLQKGETRAGLIGRQVAGKEFLDAYLSYGSWTELVALVRNPASAQSLLHLCQNHPSSRNRRRGLKIVEEREFHRHFFPNPPAPLLYNPCPPDLRYAWARQHKGPGVFALSGVTHTLCSQRALEWIGDLVTAPFESYDSLICTSRAAVDMVRTTAQTYADYLRDRHGGAPQIRIRLEHIPLGVNTDLFRPATPEERKLHRREFHIQDDEVAVLFVGRLAHHAKAHPFPMYHALAHAARTTGRKVHLVLSGWAANQAIMDAFEQGARDFAPNLRTSFVDGTDPKNRFAVWQTADIFTSLSDNIQETFGLVIVEAMASGLPVVASDWNGYRDLVVPGETGFLVPSLMVPGATADATSRLQMEEMNYDHFLAECSQCVAVDCTEAAQAFARLLSEADLRRRMGAAGRQRALQLFAWPRIIRAYENLWAQQEVERQTAAKATRRSPSWGLGPARHPAPEAAFASFPSRWLDSDQVLQATPEATARLDQLLTHPLTHHEPQRRCTDQRVLNAVLMRTADACTMSEIQDLMANAGVLSEIIPATIAWLLKYDLLQTRAS
jgi:glycosyltransferase involved in cell wall biosynthesis